ncbi:hypothetical protein VPH35_082861 [Triticum aestivum]
MLAPWTCPTPPSHLLPPPTYSPPFTTGAAPAPVQLPPLTDPTCLSPTEHLSVNPDAQLPNGPYLPLRAAAPGCSHRVPAIRARKQRGPSTHGSAPSCTWWPNGMAGEVLRVRDGKEWLPRLPLPTIVGGSAGPATSSVVGLGGPRPLPPYFLSWMGAPGITTPAGSARLWPEPPPSPIGTGSCSPILPPAVKRPFMGDLLPAPSRGMTLPLPTSSRPH